MTFLPRDQSLDSELESGAHLTLILVAIGLAFLFTATAIFFYLFPACRIVRRSLFSRQQPVNDVDPAQVQNSANGKEVFQPKMTSTPQRQLALAQPPCHQPQRSPTFFASRHPLLPPNPPSNRQTSDSSLARNRTNPHHHRHHHHRPHLPPPLPSAHIKPMPPDISGWMMRTADEVVGRHPFAKPLFERVATRAEIALISGHVDIPWAHEARRYLKQNTVVKDLGPVHETQRRFGHLELGSRLREDRALTLTHSRRQGYL